MKLEVDASEIMNLLENSLNINNAILEVAKKAGEGSVNDTLDEVNRSHQLILQALKSITATIHEIRERAGI